MSARTTISDRELLRSYERGDLVSTRPSKGRIEQLKRSASKTLLKDRRVNIRLSSPDLMDIQARAVEEGMPYQTLMASVLHKYVTGQLVARPSRLAARPRTRVAKVRAS